MPMLLPAQPVASRLTPSPSRVTKLARATAQPVSVASQPVAFFLRPLSFQVLVMTPTILLRSLRHSFLKFNMIKVLIMDECHHARGRDPYVCIMRINNNNSQAIYMWVSS
ncbi:hypothetical protein RIF29_15081 [Crotalaria pallida]|uniref:Helicase ATP-binding domain-containing protein n=1 Tax=Crotalaria pallida TaxID=3830 RepID=A0AAN9FEZ6_CROPI